MPHKVMRLSVLVNTGFAICTLAVFGVCQADGDLELGRFEIGGHFAYLKRSVPEPPSISFSGGISPSPFLSSASSVSEAGLGARFTFNFTKSIAVEAEYNFFPADSIRLPGVQFIPLRRQPTGFGTGGPPPLEVSDIAGQKHQAVFGPKVGYRGKRIGIFGKVRPGFVQLERYLIVQRVERTANSISISARLANNVSFFNLDVGGVFELYPTRRTVVRVDVGDTIIRYGGKEPREFNPSFIRHNLHTNLGFGFRF